MKKDQVEIGKTYNVKVSGRVQPVRLLRASPYGGWDGVNVRTQREIHIRSAARLRSIHRCRKCDNCRTLLAEKTVVVEQVKTAGLRSTAGQALQAAWTARCKELPCTSQS